MIRRLLHVAVAAALFIATPCLAQIGPSWAGSSAPPAGAPICNLNTIGGEFSACAGLGSAPTATGTCAVTTQVGGDVVGSFVMTGACPAGTVILTFGGVAPHGWICAPHDQTTAADVLNQTANSTTTCTLTGTAAAGDVITFSAQPY